MSDKRYFKRAINLPFLYKFAFYIRREKFFKLFIENIRPFSHEKIIDLGVFSGNEEKDHNFFEELYEYKHNITACGIDDASFLEKTYPGLKFVKIIPGEKLPFKDNEFDIGFSNAVIEHVGSFKEQEFFLKELIRVSGRVFVGTPNRFFPLEFHVLLPFLHWLPKPVFRRILKKIKLDFYSKEENLNLLRKSEMLELVPPSYRDKVELQNYRLFGMVSNLFLIIRK